MKKHIRILFKEMLCIYLIINLTGCWNSRELNTLAIVMGTGIDISEEPDKVQLTLQIAKPSEMKSSKGEGGGEGKAYFNFTIEEDTVFNAIRGATHEVSRKLFYPHNQIIIISEEIAKGDVQKYFDFFIRDHETRTTSWVLISKGRAEEVLNVKPKQEKIPALEISRLVLAQGATSESSITALREFAVKTMSKTTAPVAPIIEVKGEGGNKSINISGTAVFKGWKLAGELDKKESRGLLWVIGKVKSGIVTVNYPDETSRVSLEIIKASSKITPVINGDNIKFRINIKEEGNLGEEDGYENLTLPARIAALEKKKEMAIKNEVMAAFNRSKELNADIFGFGEIIHQRKPKEWENLENRWDEVFPEIQLEVNVEAKLRLTGRIGRPAVPE